MDQLEHEEVKRLLEDLTTDQSDVLALRLLSQMSVDEVAAALEKPPGAVKSLQHRALATLRRRLDTETYADERP